MAERWIEEALDGAVNRMAEERLAGLGADTIEVPPALARKAHDLYRSGKLPSLTTVRVNPYMAEGEYRLLKQGRAVFEAVAPTAKG